MAELMNPTELLAILEGNRRLTLRVMQAFTEQDLFHYTPVAPMRTFAKLALEIFLMEEAIVRAIKTGEFTYDGNRYQGVATAQELLEVGESVRAQTLALWPELSAERLLVKSQDPWAPYPQNHLDRLVYCLENEIHHRGQGYVYLRMLGFEPPAFWER
jgi:uncharacterized damage-inducible protein DinB